MNRVNGMVALVNDRIESGAMVAETADVLPMACLTSPEKWRNPITRLAAASRSARIVVCIFLYSCLDAVFTIMLTAHGAVELNPVMAFYLAKGPHLFVSVKIFLTGSSLFVLYTYRKEAIGRLNMRIDAFFTWISGAFIALLGWEFYLIYRILH